MLQGCNAPFCEQHMIFYGYNMSLRQATSPFIITPHVQRALDLWGDRDPSCLNSPQLLHTPIFSLMLDGLEKIGTAGNLTFHRVVQVYIV